MKKKHIFLFILAAVILFFLGTHKNPIKNHKIDKNGSELGASSNKIPEFTPKNAYKILYNSDYVFIDVREPEEYAIEHINGAINIPLSSFKEAYFQVPQDKKVILVCRSGSRSAFAYKFLIEKGYKNKIFNLKGGMLLWQELGLDFN